MTADQPICCPTCKGVLITQQRDDYTAARGRLVVTNGYCQGRCPAPDQPSGSGVLGQDGSLDDRPARRPDDMSAPVR